MRQATYTLMALCACLCLSSGCRSKRVVEPCLEDWEARFCKGCFSKKDTKRIWCYYGLFQMDTPVDLRDLHPFEALEAVDLANKNVTDLAPLAEHPGLQDLNLLNTHVHDLRPIANLRRLEALNIGNTHVVSLEPLRKLHALRSLWISGTMVSDLSPLTGLKELTDLHIEWTRVKDLEPLMGLDKLKVLWVTEGAFSPEQLDALRSRIEHLEISTIEPRRMVSNGVRP